MEFKKYKLSELSKENKGTYGIGASAVDYSEDLYTYLRITDIKEDGSLDYSNLKSIDDSNAEKYILKKGDIVFARTGNSTGKAYYYDGEIPNLVYAGFLIKFTKDKKKVNPKFIKYYTMTKEYKNWVKEIQTGSTRSNINEKMYGNMEVRLPSRIYQDKMVSLLERIDKKIELNNQINNNLQKLTLTLYKQFIEDNNDAEEVLLEDCVKKIGTGADAIQRAPIVDYATGIRCIRVGDMTNNRKCYEWAFTKMTDRDFNNYKLDIGDIVITRTAVNGIAYLIEDSMKVVCNNGLIRLKINENYNPLYIFLTMKTKDFYDYIHRIDSETSVRPNMKVDYLTSYRIKKISLEKQNQFCDMIKPMRKRQKAIEHENNNLIQLRDTLLPKLMNVEINLDNIEI